MTLHAAKDCEENNLSQLIEYRNGEYVGEIVEDAVLAYDKNLVEVGPTECTYGQKDGVLLTLKCLSCWQASAVNSEDALEWVCKECRENIRYNKSTDKFYCKCGSSAPTDARFCCSRVSHGVDFVQYDENELSSPAVST